MSQRFDCECAASLGSIPKIPFIDSIDQPFDLQPLLTLLNCILVRSQRTVERKSATQSQATLVISVLPNCTPTTVCGLVTLSESG